MSKHQYDSAKPLAIVALVLFCLIAFADVIGRLREWLIGEMPYITWGLVILFSAVWFLAIAWEHVARQNRFEKRIGDLAERYKERILRESRWNSGRLKRLEDSFTALSRRLDDHHDLCQQTIRKVDELLERKGPLVTTVEPTPELVPASSDTEMQSAVSEVTGGLA